MILPYSQMCIHIKCVTKKHLDNIFIISFMEIRASNLHNVFIQYGIKMEELQSENGRHRFWVL